MARIVDFLEALVDDAALEANFEQAPIRTMTAFGLTSEQGLVIIGGTLAELRDAIKAEVGDVPVIMARMFTWP